MVCMQSRVHPTGVARLLGDGVARALDRDAALADAWRALWMSRLLVWAAGVVAVLVFGLSSRAGDFDPAGVTSPFGTTGDVLAAPFARWDSVWYLAIAGSGYGGGAREAFFPLYPLVVQLAGLPAGSALVGGALASTALLGVALVLLHRLVALDHPRAVARNAVLVTALLPMSFFFSAVYSESLFLALSVGAVYAARRERWALAGALGGLGALTRSAGVLLLVPLLILYLWDTGSLRRRPRVPRLDVLWLALVPAGLAVYCAYLGLAGYDALAPFHAQEVWFRSFAGPFLGAWDGAVAAWQGARQLLVRRARAGVLHGLRRRPVRRRAPQHRAARVARADRRRDDRRAAAAARGVRRVPRRGARAAALLPRRAAAADVAAALRGGAVPAVDLACAVDDRARLARAARAGRVRVRARRLHGDLRDLALGGVCGPSCRSGCAWAVAGAGWQGRSEGVGLQAHD